MFQGLKPQVIFEGGLAAPTLIEMTTADWQRRKECWRNAVLAHWEVEGSLLQTMSSPTLSNPAP